MNLPLFDIPMQNGAGQTGRPVDAGDANQELRASSDHEVIAPPQGFSRSDTDGVRRAQGSEIPPSSIERVITHRYGTFLHLREGGLAPREFRVVELHDGRLFDEYLDDGQREPSRLSHTEIKQGLREQKFREVRQ